MSRCPFPIITTGFPVAVDGQSHMILATTRYTPDCSSYKIYTHKYNTTMSIRNSPASPHYLVCETEKARWFIMRKRFVSSSRTEFKINP